MTERIWDEIPNDLTCSICGLCDGDPIPWIMCRDEDARRALVCEDCFTIWHDQGQTDPNEIRRIRHSGYDPNAGIDPGLVALFRKKRTQRL